MTKALNKVPGVTARVSLEENAAYIDASYDADVERMKEAVADAGYEVVGIENAE